MNKIEELHELQKLIDLVTEEYEDLTVQYANTRSKENYEERQVLHKKRIALTQKLDEEKQKVFCTETYWKRISFFGKLEYRSDLFVCECDFRREGILIFFESLTKFIEIFFEFWQCELYDELKGHYVEFEIFVFKHKHYYDGIYYIPPMILRHWDTIKENEQMMSLIETCEPANIDIVSQILLGYEEN